jgi:hypothetical protein
MYILPECIAEIVEKKQINVFYRPQHRAGIKDFAFHFRKADWWEIVCRNISSMPAERL